MTESMLPMNGRNPRRRWLWGLLWTAVLLFGAAGVWSRLADGHHAANYGSYVTWGLWVAAYIYFLGISAGAFLIVCTAYVFRIERLLPAARLALLVAIVTLPLGLTAIWFDLGHMSRVFYMFLYPDFSSVMAWMVWLYSAYFVLLLVMLRLAMAPDLERWADEDTLRGRVARALLLGRSRVTDWETRHGGRWLRRLAIVGLPLAIVFSGGVGALFGTVSARGFWHSSLIPILFLAGALVSAAALVLGLYALFGRHGTETYRQTLRVLGRLVIGLVALDLLLEWAEFSIPMWYGIGPEYHLLQEVLFGEFWYVFWVFHILLGSAIPLALLLARPRSRRAAGLAGLLVATTFLAVRLNVVIPGMVEPQLQGLAGAYTDARLSFSYVPSLMEWQVVVFLVAVAGALFYLGHRFLPLFSPPAAAGPHLHELSHSEQ